MGTCFRNLATTLTLSLCFILRSYAASHYHQQQQKKQQLPYAMVVGSVYCNTCFQPDFSELSRSIPDASVEVKCDGNGKNQLWFQKQVKTDHHGAFRFRLPLELSRNAKVIETCSVKLVRSSRSICSMASPETSAGRLLRLRSRRHGVLIFSAGFVACNHKSRPSVSAKFSLFPPLIPFLPSPPNIGGIPLPPNPLQPPPSIFPPLPFQPSPPPFSVFPPLPFQPPPPPFSIIPPLPNIPLLPFLVPPPPPPPPAFLFPPLPLPPFFPGHPPAASAQGTNK